MKVAHSRHPRATDDLGQGGRGGRHPPGHRAVALPGAGAAEGVAPAPEADHQA
jgi:hypothetical protein